MGREPLGTVVLVEGAWPETGFVGERPRCGGGACMDWAGIVRGVVCWGRIGHATRECEWRGWGE